ncbi:LysE family translocator [Pseudomonas mandelii]|uniref:LysE family translocator n=1 Tax=Pseudomonas mandelii TaxID=75612 RepID=A0A502IEV2_9PSED|nr:MULTISPECIES: LysE family translocator [Pseudomonas]TPG84664.1 LysE family translocator [Pseudomonas mandelii]TPG98130.1 LysE family translocator [Pseudomonas caspiana]
MLSTFPTLLPFLLFAFVASITPGPTNILVLSNSARYGFKAALPIIFGACISAAMIVWLVGSGFGKVLNTYPGIGTATQVIGSVWLTYLSWQIFCAPLDSMVRTKKPSVQPRRPGSVDAAALQLINPKTWMMALAVVSVFVPGDSEKSTAVLQLSVIFFLVALPCLGAWAVVGVQVGTRLRSPHAQKYFNRAMGILLLGAVWLPLLMI